MVITDGSDRKRNNNDYITRSGVLENGQSVLWFTQADLILLMTFCRKRLKLTFTQCVDDSLTPY